MTAKPKPNSARASDSKLEHLQFQVYGLAVIAVLLAIVALYPMFAAKCAVEIYRHDATGAMTYCETGDLSGNPAYTYMGSGTIDCSLASGC